MRVKTTEQPLWRELLERHANFAEMQEKTARSLEVVATRLARWLRRTGRTGVSPWVAPELERAIAAELVREPPPSTKQLALQLGVDSAQVRVVAAALWNRNHPVAHPPVVPDEVELDDLLAQRLSLAELVRATGLHPATLESHIAQYLAAQREPDASPWLSEAQTAQVSALLDGANAWHNVRRAQARSEITRGQVAMVLAVRGQWRARARDGGQRLPERTGKTWSRGEDVVLGAAFATGTRLGALAQALSRTPGAVLVRAVHLGLLGEALPTAWPDASAQAA